MSVFVVAWHMNIPGRSLTYSQAEYFSHAPTLSDFVNFHVLLLAVPTCVLLSNYLYALNGASAPELLKRLKRIGLLLSFWPIAWILYNKGFHGLLDRVPHSVGAFLTTVLRAGHTIYYFFVSLMICLVATRIVARWSVRTQVAGLIVSTLGLSCMTQLSLISHVYQLSAYWNPLNFVPFSFAAVLVAQHRHYIHLRRAIVVGILIAITVVFSQLEWNLSAGTIFFPDQAYSIPPYTRSSLVPAVMAICIIALEANMKGNSVTRFMAKNALSLYCLHPFVMGPVKGLLSVTSQSNLVMSIGSLGLVIVTSYGLAMLLKLYFKHELLM